MEVRWTSITLLLVTLVVKVHCYPEDHAQSSETTGEHKSITRKDSPLQQNVFSNAEFKSQDTEAEEITKTSTTELLVLPTPVAVTHEDTEKKPSVPKKGVPSTKSSVVPKKEVHFIPSVVAKKGADPESSTPSVSPRKGVELSQGSLIHNVQLASIENMNIDGNFSQSSSGDVNSKNVPSRIDETKNETHIEKETKENIIYIPNPHLVKKGKANDNLLSGKQNSSQTLVHLASTSPPTVHSKSGVVSNIGHFKPTTTDDVSATSSQVTYAPIFVIVALVVLLVVVVVVGYHRLKGIWVRRHYDYVDFLIDGMYE
ncbi:uncharacterized protein LOC123505626 isoform X3 [Portunus trituberculatus]|uniref:uncharacterized protein LOC123505626 isoform X3 n=1 Tax=Portunus trituberculatus TaxID=210409 RepID=UPI001E1CF8AD|nr:uncharacterized protein LOC123505626 isoform X3 [Portunus trituberculatus]